MTLSVAHIIGILAVLVLIIGIGIYSGRKVSDASDFTTGGGKTGPWLVAGTIMGTLVSGQATVGTAQLAYSFGMSAWWFTLGSGIGCLVLALGYTGRMRHSGVNTLVGVITNEYGAQSGYLASVLSSIGIFVSVIAQMLSATALLTSVLPISMLSASIISTVIMALYVIFGGVWGAGIGGVVKLLLLYVAAIVGGVIVLVAAGGVSGLTGLLRNTLTGTPLGEVNGLQSVGDIMARFGSLVARGPLNDLGSGLSLVLGVLSTQTYASAVWSAKSDRAARRGALLSAFLIPPIGIACILVGLFMRGHCITADEVAALDAAGQAVPEDLIQIATTSQVFPTFILHYMPPLFGGIVLGTLLITIVGGGAGLSLGVATIAIDDIGRRLTRKLDAPKLRLVATRLAIVVVLAVSALVATMVPSAVINDFGYLSMGLRGAVIFVPLSAALFFRGRVGHRWVVASIVAGPVGVIAGSIANAPFDSLFIGVFASLILCIVGGLRRPGHTVSQNL